MDEDVDLMLRFESFEDFARMTAAHVEATLEAASDQLNMDMCSRYAACILPLPMGVGDLILRLTAERDQELWDAFTELLHLTPEEKTLLPFNVDNAVNISAMHMWAMAEARVQSVCFNTVAYIVTALQELLDDASADVDEISDIIESCRTELDKYLNKFASLDSHTNLASKALEEWDHYNMMSGMYKPVECAVSINKAIERELDAVKLLTPGLRTALFLLNAAGSGYPYSVDVGDMRRWVDKELFSALPDTDIKPRFLTKIDAVLLTSLESEARTAAAFSAAASASAGAATARSAGWSHRSTPVTALSSKEKFYSHFHGCCRRQYTHFCCRLCQCQSRMEGCHHSRCASKCTDIASNSTIECTSKCGGKCTSKPASKCASKCTIKRASKCSCGS
ncbi:hypothetical protein JKP88DRAFT_244888 [Tribonema minus]|uniref:Uncharacterized protein n=1 Tax=Tribonema minus TaxID=303371 RepID=A0A835Z079_9STRA|nr:hypothetical protein JKP88DRAFT_244888 [Tribonema minus]